MKNFILTLAALFSGFTCIAQTAGPDNPAAAVTVPGSACLACPGSLWMNDTNVFVQDNNLAAVALQANAQCFQSNCYYSRYLYASNFGFSIPGAATINGITVDIYRQPGNPNSAADSSVRLVQNNLPAGQNKAIAGAWPATAAYYAYGSSGDLWGLTWTPADINTVAFGVYLRVFNMSANVITPSVDHIRITVDYTMPTGIHFSQSASPSSFNVYQQQDEVQVAFSATNTGMVSIRVFDMTGREKGRKELDCQQGGLYTSSFDTSGLAEGIYLVQVQSGSSVSTKKIVIQH